RPLFALDCVLLTWPSPFQQTRPPARIRGDSQGRKERVRRRAEAPRLARNEANMQDDFDNGMEVPDDELAGESAASEDLGDLGGAEGEGRAEGGAGSAPAGRPSGGARARKSSSARKSAGARKAAKSGAKKAAKKKSAAAGKGGSKKKGGAKKKAAKKGSRKAGRKK